MSELTEADEWFLRAAIEQARAGLGEGGIPIGVALAARGELLGTGRNRRVQAGSVIRHGETDCLENVGRLDAATYARACLYTTLSPCPMCTGAILLYKIPRVVIGENTTFTGSESLLREHGVEVVVADSADCRKLMTRFVADHPDIWNEDIGEPLTGFSGRDGAADDNDGD